MLNNLKKWIYTTFTRRYIAYQWEPLFIYTARLLEKLFGLVIFNYHGVKLLASPVSYLDRHIILNKDINPLVTHAISQHLVAGGVFLDIGANHGVFSLLAAKNPQTKVFAFEPSARELHRFWKNLALNPSNNISVLAYGVGEQEGRQDFMLTGIENPGANSLPVIRDQGELVTCHFSRLDKLLSVDLLKQVRVCKLDVEGQEMFILNSLRPYLDLLKQCVFIVEVSPDLLPSVGASEKDIYHVFAEAGFQYQFGNPENLHQWDEFFYHPEFTEELTI